MFITNGVHADLLFVAARTESAAERGGRSPHGISIFAVERGTPGLRVGRTLHKHGWRASDTAELVFASDMKEWVKDVKVTEGALGKILTVVVSGEHESARITEIVRLSKPGRRAYAGAAEIPAVKRGRGIVIVSTSKGMMTGDQAKKHGVGGELICRVY